jgi:hypothetical protein
MMKKLMVTTARSGLMVGTALAQSTAPAERPVGPPPAVTQPAPSGEMKGAPGTDAKVMPSPSSAKVINSQRPDQWVASKFKSTDVVGADSQKIGDVNDLLFAKDGKIEAFIVSVGGFLGIGTKYVAIDPAAFQLVPGDKSKNESDKLRLPMTKEQLQQAANFEYYNPPRATTGMAPTRPAPVPAPAPR